MISYILIILTGTITWLICKLFLEVEVKGRENLPKDIRGYIIATNHQTLIDSWFIILLMRSLLYYILHPSQVPWNVPEFKNYFKTWVLKFFFSHLRCLPIKRGQMTPQEMKNYFKRVAKILKKAALLIFFEGTRSRTGKIGEPKTGIGLMVCQNKCQVIPILIDGFNQILPVGAKALKVSLRHRIKVSMRIGKPLAFDDLCQQPNDRKTYLAIGQRIKQVVEQL